MSVLTFFGYTAAVVLGTLTVVGVGAIIIGAIILVTLDEMKKQ